MINAITLYVIERFKSDEMVNTITLNDRSIVDTKKENIYTLVAINFIDKVDTNDLYNYNFTIHVLQQRDSNRKLKPSKLMEDSNYIDNLADTESICNKFINYIRRMEIDLPLTIENLSSIRSLSEYGVANLDGFVFDITLGLPNTGYCGV